MGKNTITIPNDTNDGWEAVASKSSKRKDRHRNHQTAASPLTWIDELPIIPAVESFPSSLLLLIGRPGSGKSTFSAALCRSMPWKYVRVNQDELKSRSACEAAMQRALRCGQCPIIDRCNMSKSQRKNFKVDNIPVDCILFDIPAEICLVRCQTRRDHPTVAPNMARQIIQWQSNDYEPPLASEGFRTITTIRDNQSFRKVLEDLVQAKP